jgi:hypothetical protein
MGVTSKQKGYHYGYELKNWRYAGLARASWVRFEYLELRSDKFKRKLGMLHLDDIQGLQEWLNDLAYGRKRYGLR